MRVLIHNSDSPENRGDRAILVGIIALVRRTWPEAEVWSLSPYVERDEKWFGIRFAPQSPYSTSPRDFVRLLRLARGADVVLWGGGEILKDYTNKLGLVYWLLKIRTLRLANGALLGAFQGIGPTSAGLSKWLIARTVSAAKAFLLRDEESERKLAAWGVKIPLIASYDPAVLGTPAPFDAALEQRLVASADVDGAFLRNAVGLGVRKWFHYRQGGWIPNRFKRARPADEAEDPRVDEYRGVLAEAADRQIERHGRNVVFFPMHMHGSEDDAGFAASVVARMRNPERTRIVANDDFSSNEYAGILAQLPVFVASRLHSAILATMAGVPSCVYYYVDKGRLFFEQLGMQRFSSPIEALLDEGAVDQLEQRIEQLVAERDAVRAELRTAVSGMGDRIVADFTRAVGLLG